MRANHGEAARQTRALALDSVGIEQPAVVLGPLRLLGLLLHDSYVCVWNAKLSLRVVISNAFQQSLTRAE